jgi:AraC-like DNA-binding protein
MADGGDGHGRGDAAGGDYAVFECAADLHGLEYLRAHYVSHNFAAHTHPDFAVGVIDDGVGAFALNRVRHISPAGSLVAINPEEPHTGGPYGSSDLTYSMLYPSPELMQTIARSVGGRPIGEVYFPRAVVEDRPLAEQFRRLFRVLTASPDALERESALARALASLVARHAGARPRPVEPRRAPRAVALARDYLDAHYADNVTLGELARVAEMSAYRLVRVFHGAVGLPPHKYLTQRRVAAAKRLLAAGTSLADVAAATGFVDQSHLTRHFKRMVGIAPGRYARALGR